MKTQLKLSMAVLAACFTFSAVGADAAKSMRGLDVAAPDPVAAEKNYVGKRPGTQEPVARTFSTQPPVIPHAVENFDEVTLEGNQCLDCHGAANFKKKNAPKIGDSHFVNRDGQKLPEAAAGRHNCTQCHVPQVDAPPLVENAFQGDKIVTGSKGAK
ncbi:MAG TPA: nitrate reductase cytochrome c-type subunit [Azospira sp.]|nr:nitrate reductase cytochrome c-type subunit [Azospira sp.]